MKLPGFTAQASIGPASQRYRSPYQGFSGPEQVAAQADDFGEEEMEENGEAAEQFEEEEQEQNGGEA